ncbi:MAG: LysM peptidoglycan-binding domain-containing protein [Caldilineaceae bacterium]|nr:LysM peptidoglycan-binding domain-containing protein [Caldilineaceae bacterium]
MGLPIRWILKLSMVILVVGILAGCTRERAAETLPAGTAPEATTNPGTTPDEPQVIVVPLPSPAPVDTPTPEPTATPAFATAPYTVQPGDTVSTIAERFGVTSQTIREMNLLTSDALQVGQVLRVPNTTGAGTTASGDPAPPAGPFEYVVKAGDTLLSIAIEFGVSANDIVAENTLSNPNNLFVGQTIIIPNYQPQTSPTPISATPYEYVIQAGDTLLSIAQRFGVSADTIMQANTLRDANNLIQGQVLFIPGYQGSTTGTTAGRASSSTPAVHIVRAGETLFAIAQTYGVTAAELVTANQITNPNQLQTGQRLIIPGVTAAEIEAANRVIHVVAAGEGLNAIARRYNVSVNAIIEANNISNPNFLTVGQQLIIPRSE